LDDFFKSFPLKPLGQMNWNLVGSIYGRSSIEIAHFGHYERFIWYFFCWESSIKSQNIEIRINLSRTSFTLVTSSQSMSSILYRGPGWPSGYGHLLLNSQATAAIPYPDTRFYHPASTFLIIQQA
jgi:hypothetical protein